MEQQALIDLKKTLDETFDELKQHNMRMYKEFEIRLKEELSCEIHHYRVYTGLMNRAKWHLEGKTGVFQPICKNDLEESTFSKELFITQMKQEQPFLLKKVFIACEYLKLKKLVNAHRLFKGTIQTDEGIFEIRFELKRCTSYLDEIALLYKDFVYNQVPWNTVNQTYMSRMFEVYIMPMDYLKDITHVDGIKLDFEEFKDEVEEAVFPVWNIKRSHHKTKGFPVPCKDHFNYEHYIPLLPEEHSSGILLEAHAPYVERVNLFQNHMLIKSPKEDAALWHIKKIEEPTPYYSDMMKYPFFGTYKVQPLIERHYFMPVRTQAELARRINSYGWQEEIVYLGAVVETGERPCEEETYTMNSFVIDEIRSQSNDKRLMLKFKLKQPHLFYARDVISQIVSDIQFLYPEYRCEGRIV